MRRFLPFLLLTFAVVASGAADSTHEVRLRMVEDQIAARGVTDPKVLDVMKKIPRHLYVPDNIARHAYEDRPLPIGFGQTISQPFIVAQMTELLQVKPSDRVLEIGAGSGYQAAVLAEIVKEVITIEIVPELAEQAKRRMKDLGYTNTTVIAGDGYFGWKKKAPYDAIIVTAAAAHIPPPLIDQLKPGGRMVIPVGPALHVQHLILFEKKADGTVVQRVILPVRFVPLTGGR